MGIPGSFMVTSEKSALAWFSPVRFAILLALILAASFPKVVLAWRAFGYGDASQFAYPFGYYLRESIRRGEIPLWNPLNSCGIPFLAQWNTMALYPPALFYVIFPMPWSFGMFSLGHMFLGGMGMYFLTRRWTGNCFAASLAGLVFAFNGFTWYGVMWPYMEAAMGWMPWVILLLERAREEGGKFIVYAALAVGLQLLSGGAELVLQTAVIAVLLAAADLAARPKAQWQIFARSLTPAILGAGLAMAQVLPFVSFLGQSHRTADFATSDYGQIAAMPLTGWINYFVPLFHCQPNYNGVYMQANQPWTGSYYVGISIVVLALLAVWRSRDVRVRLLAGVAAVGLLMSFGEGGFVQEFAVKLIPILGFIRFPVKYVMMVTFALPLLAAFGVVWLTKAEPEKWRVEWNHAKRLVFAALALVATVVAFEKLHPQGDDFGTILGNAGLRCVFLIATAGCIPFAFRLGGAKTQRCAQAGVLFLAWMDVLTHAPDLSPTASVGQFEPGMVRQLFGWRDEMRAGTTRAMRGKETFWVMLNHGSKDPDDDLQARRYSMFMNLNLLDDAAKFDGFTPLDSPLYLNIFKGVYFGTNDAVGLLDFLGISEIGNPTNVFGWNHRPTARPLISAGQKPIFLSEANALTTIFSDQFDSSRLVCLLDDARNAVHASGGGGSEILFPQFSAHAIHFKTQSATPAMVVIAQTYFPNWRARVDGNETPLWRANYAFQALEVPAGAHEVDVIYKDAAFETGVVISATSLVACGVWLIAFRKGVVKGA